ncbi:hypothetical protein T439DRAFT_320720 [Meredithblackwellia eburnea MCA 4105]
MAPRASTSKLPPARGGDGDGTPSSSSTTTTTTTKKTSQRPSWSCMQCTKKKIKCSKVIPCIQCVGRGKRDECRLADQDPSLPPRDPSQNPHRPTRPATEIEFTALQESLTAVKQRLFHLEEAMANFVPVFGSGGEKEFEYVETSGGSSGAGRVRSGSDLLVKDEPNGMIAVREESAGGSGTESREQTVTLEADTDVEAAVTLEALALGRARKEDHFNRAEVRRPSEDLENVDPSASAVSLPFPPSDSGILAAPASAGVHTALSTGELPEVGLGDRIIRFSLEKALWQHSCVHPSSFLAECEEFHGWKENRASLVNQAWLALYFALLCTGVKHMTVDEAFTRGLAANELKPLARQYYDSAIACLHRANFMARHTVFSVQCIIVLNYSCLDIGGSDYSATLLSCGIRIAQSMALHRFTSDAQWEQTRRERGIDPKSPEGIKGLIVREIRKRLWAALKTDDWFGAAYRRPYAIFPAHCTTPPPNNCHDEDLSAGLLINRPLDTPCVTTKLILTMRVADCIRRFFEDLSQAGGMNAELCRQVDGEINAVLRSAPAFLQADADLSHLPSFVGSLRRYLLISIQHKLLVTHRTFVGRSRKGAQYAYSRKAMSEAAKTILVQFTRPGEFQHVWTVPYHAVVASTTIILEMFQAPDASENSEKRLLVQMAVERLRSLANSSPIASRGSQLVASLLADEASRQSSASTSSSTLVGGRKRTASEADLDVNSLAKRYSTSISPSLAPHALHSTTSSPTEYALPTSLSFTGGTMIDGDQTTMDSSAAAFGASDQDSTLDWLLANPDELTGSWGGMGAVGLAGGLGAGGGAGGGMMISGAGTTPMPVADVGLWAQDAGIDFWKLLDGFEPGTVDV